MSFRATKIGGASILTILGVVCLGTLLIAAFTWSTQSTLQKGPQEVSLGTPSVNKWDAAIFFEANKPYDISLQATYNHHGSTQISYYIQVVATAGTGTIEASDFTVTLFGISGASLSEIPAGTWTTGIINVPSGTTSQDIIVMITPTNNALDLDDVSFAISALSVT